MVFKRKITNLEILKQEQQLNKEYCNKEDYPNIVNLHCWYCFHCKTYHCKEKDI